MIYKYQNVFVFDQVLNTPLIYCVLLSGHSAVSFLKVFSDWVLNQCYSQYFVGFVCTEMANWENNILLDAEIFEIGK